MTVVIDNPEGTIRIENVVQITPSGKDLMLLRSSGRSLTVPTESALYVMDEDLLAKAVTKETDDISVESIENTISDIAGIRIVCSFLSDLEEIKDVLKNHLGLEIVKEKDYVNYPKENGYIGYHLIVNIPIPIGKQIEKVKVEIQVRTIAMDMWAIIERNLRPRNMTTEEREKELHALAAIRDEIDNTMESIIKEAKEIRESNSKSRNKTPTTK